MNSFMNLFNRKKANAAKKPCCVDRCGFYDEIDMMPRSLFDDDFPTSNTLITSVGRNIRGVRAGIETNIECKPDGSISGSLKPEVVSTRFFNVSATVKGMNNQKTASFLASFTDIPKLPGLKGKVGLSTGTERCQVMTQYNHPFFSVVSDNTFKQNRDFAFVLNAAGRYKTGFIGGISAKMDARYDKTKESLLKKYSFGFGALDGRASYAQGPWNMFLQCSNFGRDYSFIVMRKVFVSYWTNEMLVAARLNAHAMIPDMSDAKTFKEKLAAVNDAIRPVATFAARTKVSPSSSLKVKINTKGAIGISFSEQLSKWAQAVFALHLNGKNLSAAGQNTLNFTLTISN